jgi:hypothetical protein
MADNDQLLEKIRAIIREETVSKEEFRASEERLTKKIEASQEDTIEVLSELSIPDITCMRSASVPLKSS